MNVLADVDLDTALSQCRALHDVGRYAEAQSLANECVRSSAGEPDLHWKSLTTLGNVLRADERFGPALDAHVNALQIALTRKHAVHTAMSWNNLGVIFVTASAWDLAIECFSRVTEDKCLARASSPYLAHGNLALCHLHLDSIRQGTESIRQALRLETEALIARHPHAYVAFRLTFIQLALQGNRILPDEINRRAEEARVFAAGYADTRIGVLSELITANVEFAFGVRSTGLEMMASLRLRAQAIPQIISDVLFALVQAEKLAGRPERARAYLDEWSLHLYADGAAQAKTKLDIASWLPTGEFLKDHLRELGLDTETLPRMPARILELMKGRLDNAA
ncbi:MAG: hypothetical protein ABL931_01525 [Usitatibacteraceae bacterium]